MLEDHYTVPELAKLWHVSSSVVRGMFAKEPDVFRLERPEARFKRQYTSVRIPRSVARRVYKRIAA